MARGRFISIEGGEGAGKSTQILHLKARLEGRGCDLLLTREPGGSAGAEAIRQLLVTGDTERWSPMAEALLNFAARQDHVERTILPALENGTWVISDRFADSTIAYQGVAQGLGIEKILALWRIVLGDFRPDLTLILDIDPAHGLNRSARRLAGDQSSEDRYERMGMAFHQKLRQGFIEMATRDPGRCKLIDATGTEAQVSERLWTHVNALSEPVTADE